MHADLNLIEKIVQIMMNNRYSAVSLYTVFRAGVPNVNNITVMEEI